MENPFSFLLLARRRLSSVAERTRTNPLLQKFSFQRKSNSRVTVLRGQAEITTPLCSRSASLILQVPESALRNLHSLGSGLVYTRPLPALTWEDFKQHPSASPLELFCIIPCSAEQASPRGAARGTHCPSPARGSQPRCGRHEAEPLL